MKRIAVLLLLLCGCSSPLAPKLSPGRPVVDPWGSPATLLLSYPVDDTIVAAPWVLVTARAWNDSLEIRARRDGGAPLLPYWRWNIEAALATGGSAAYYVAARNGLYGPPDTTYHVWFMDGTETGHARLYGSYKGFVLRIALADIGHSNGSLTGDLIFRDWDTHSGQPTGDWSFHCSANGQWSSPESRAESPGAMAGGFPLSGMRVGR